jgi:predicted MFS family arabinose efflux permease
MPVTSQDAQAGISPAARSSIIGGIISLLIDSYDIYVPAFILPAALNYFEPSTMAATTKVTLVSVIFTVTLLARPVGGPIFGHLGDKIGRKRVTMICGAGFTVTTLVIACLPGYGTWGFGALVALIALRFVDGVFLGGGYAGPVPLAIERSPARLRGLVGGVVSAGAPVAIIFISVVQLTALKQITPPQYQSWGWRLPFFFGVLLGIAYLVYYSRVPEVDIEALAKDRKSQRAPLVELFSGPNFRNLLQVFLLMTGMWFAAQMMLSFLPGLLIGVLHQNSSDVSTMEIVANVATIVAMIGVAALSQRVGRRVTLIWSAAAVIVIASLAYAFMVVLANDGAAFLPIAILAIIGFVCVNGPLGCIVVYLNERFGKGVRSSGYGTAYTVSLILPSMYSVWIGVLQHVIPYDYAPLVLILVGGVLFFAGAWIGPETVTGGLLAEQADVPVTAGASLSAASPATRGTVAGGEAS